MTMQSHTLRSSVRELLTSGHYGAVRVEPHRGSGGWRCVSTDACARICTLAW
jgi:hypothetical protein